MKKLSFYVIFFVALTLFVLLTFQQSLAQTDYSSDHSPVYSSSSEKDAIAIRIVPNPNHYSIYRWYESQGFKGSPQALTVDGYDAIRDGRTVYVNAANIIPETKTIFSNVYLISYNQDPNVKTIDILGQIISHWKFNNNLEDQTLEPASCSITSLVCISNSDCQPGQACSDLGVCALSKERNCLTDGDCPANFFCDSLKAKVIRDLKRVGQIEELKDSLSKYKDVNGRYPVLSAGTYLSNNTVSVWPSWSSTFLSGLAVTQSFIDPINRLGYCPDFDQKTCWNADSKTFVYNPTASYLKLPKDSYAFVYSTNNNGSDYNLCAVMESRDATNPLLGYHFSPNDPGDNQCVVSTGILSSGVAVNTAPYLVDKSIKGESGQEFNGFIKVVDDQENPLIWALETTVADWSSWSDAPILKDTNNPSHKKLYAQRAGAPGTYNTILRVNDGEEGNLSITLPIVIENQAPFIEAESINYIVDPIIPLDYNFYIFDNSSSSSNAPLYSVVTPGSPFLSLAGIEKTESFIGSSKYKINYKGVISTDRKFIEDTTFVYKITATDEYGASSNKSFTINVRVTQPSLNLNCLSSIRVNSPYECKLGKFKQGNFNIDYSSNALPTGLGIYSGDAHALIKDQNSFSSDHTGVVGSTSFLAGIPTTVSTGEEINIVAVNEYGTKKNGRLTLKINSYCGDGVKQYPNMELRGGIYNDGYEDCDGADGVSSEVSMDSSIQYGCSTEVGVTVPTQIFGNGYCVFKSPIDGGGYCGDNFCQVAIEQNKCDQDCEPISECGDGVVDDGEVCDTPNTICADRGFNEDPTAATCINNCTDTIFTTQDVCTCPDGKTLEAEDNWIVCSICPANYYCKNGNKHVCATGKISPAGSDSPTDCYTDDDPECVPTAISACSEWDDCGVDSCGTACGPACNIDEYCDNKNQCMPTCIMTPENPC